MATSRYRNFLHVLEKWPVNKSRSDRDLGALLRKRIAEGFSQGEITVVNDIEECDKSYASLHRIITDFHKRAWERSTVTNASGTTLAELNEALSDKGLNELGAADGKSFFRRLKERFSASEK